MTDFLEGDDDDNQEKQKSLKHLDYSFITNNIRCPVKAPPQ